MSEETGVDTTAAAQDTTLTQDPVTSVDNWRDTIPEDIRNEKVITETKDLTSLAKRLVDANNFISKSVRLPADGDTSGMDELYNKLGRPESVEGYEITRPEAVDGLQYDEAHEKSFLDAAHKIGLNSSQATALIKWNQDQAKSQMASAQTNSKEAMDTLKSEWGNAFNERVGIVEEVLNQYGNDLSEAAIKDNPGLISLMYEMGKNLVEGTAEGRSTATAIRTPQEAQMEIDKLQRDPNFKAAYYDAKDPTHDAAVEQMRQLMVEAHPEPEAVVY